MAFAHLSTMKRTLLSLLFSCATLVTTAGVHTQWVNPFIGTAATGHTFPGATVPFGLAQPSPVTGAVGWQYCSEYIHSDTHIWGFTQTHLNGTGCTDLGDILLMPTFPLLHQQADTTGVAQSNDRLNLYGSRKEKEIARPGYYAVTLPDARTQVEVTSTPHVAYYRLQYQLPQGELPQLYIDLQHGPAWRWSQYHSHVKSCEWSWLDAQTLCGKIRSLVWAEQDLFFVMKFSHPMQRIDALESRPGNKGARLLTSFSTSHLEVKVALSSTSVDAALANLNAELPSWNFDEVVQQADRQWEGYLSRIQVEGSDADKTNFYTAFYHTLIQPNNIADIDGSYLDTKGKLSKAIDGKTMYSTFSLWDTYRAAHPFYTLFVPERVDGFVNSLIAQGESQGYLPIWALWGKETQTMIGNHAVSVIAEAYAKGFRGFDAERAYAIVRKTLTENHGEKTNWDIYNKYGYYPYDLVKLENVSQTLEMCYDDYAAAQFARRLGKKRDAQFFAHRSNNFKHLFDPQSGFMRPKDSQGQWRTPFHPDAVGHAESGTGDYTEGNAWQYTWHVQHDVPALIQLMGGKERFLNKLDSLFVVPLKDNFLPDVTGLIGQYAHGNEPSHHVAYLYALAGRPERTQELVRQICETQYLPKPDGLCGNDDCGQMSAWYMFSAMGFYPVDPVSGRYVFGAPQIPYFHLSLPNNKFLEIEARNLSRNHLYVKRITLNGRPYTRPYIDHATLLKGGKLVYEMGEK